MKNKTSLLKQAYIFPPVFIFLFLAIGLVHFKCASLNKGAGDTGHAGTIEGMYSVDDNGNGNYSIPISVPPGTSGIEPELSLNYTTIPTDGIAGVGWRLIGLSEITRAPATLARDSFFSYTDYSANDRYELDGQRLVLISGSYTSDSAVFHTEVESWSKITGYNRCGAGFCSFKVYMKNGLIKEYNAGVTAAGRPDIRIWALSKISDRDGNYMTIDYDMDAAHGSYYPKQITYTLNDGIKHFRYVKLGYEARPDSSVQFSGGAAYSYTKRLSSINMYLDTVLVMSYTLTYGQGASTGKSQVTAIKQCDPEGKCFPATTMKWQGESSISYTASQPANFGNIASGGMNLPMDVNGDGLIDLVYAWQSTASDSTANMFMYALFISNGSGFNAPVIVNSGLNAPSNYMPVRAMDVNGDGMIDMVYFDQSSGNILEYTVMLSNGSGFAIQPTVSTGIECYAVPDNVQQIEINGDGKSDIVFPSQSSSNRLQYQILLSNGTGFDSLAQVTTNIYAATNFPNIVTANINDDPREDLVYAYSFNSSSLVVVPLISNGTGFDTTQPPLTTSITDQYTHLMPLDMNGDHLTDLAVSWLAGDSIQTGVFYSNGLCFTQSAHSYNQPSFPVQQATIIPMEVNGDERTDFIYNYSDANGNSQLIPYISDGTSFNANPQLASPGVTWTQFGIAPLDMNGDAKSDLVNTVQPQSGSGTSLTYFTVSGAYPDLVSSIDNGIGGKIEVKYAPLTDTSVYSKLPVTGSNLGGNNTFNRISGASYAAGNPAGGVNSSPGASFPVISQVIPNYVVARFTQHDGRGAAYPYSYRYTGARYDLSGYGWLGFTSRSMADSLSNTIAVTHYAQSFFLKGKIDSTVTLRYSDNALMSRYRTSYSAGNPFPFTRMIAQVLLQKTRIDQYSYGAFNYTVGNNYTYDSYGNITLLAELGDTSKPQLTSYTIQSYTYDTDNWQMGLLTEKKIAPDSLGKTLLQWEKTDYYPGTRRQKSLQRWVSGTGANANWNSQQYQYDIYGNRTAISNITIDTTFIEYDSIYHAFPVKIIQPPNAYGKRLAELYSYSPVHGELVSKTDPNGNTIETVYDAMGRVTATLGPNLKKNMDTLTTVYRIPLDSGGYLVQMNTLTGWNGNSGDWHWVKNYQDGLDRLYRITSPGADGKSIKVTDRVLDNANRTVMESLPYFEGTPRDSITWRREEYDGYGRLTKSVIPSGFNDSTVTAVLYPAANEVHTILAFGTEDSSRSIYYSEYIKSEKQISRMIDAGGGVTEYRYDALGRVTGTTDPLGYTARMFYDGIGRRTSFSDTSLGTTTYTSNDSLNTITQNYSNGKSVTTRFDRSGRLSMKTSSDKDTIFYIYDDPSVANGLGQLTSVKMPGGIEYRYSYDMYGNMASIGFVKGGASYITTQSYTPNSLMDQLKYPDGSVLQYGYTYDGNISYLDLDDAADGTEGNYKRYAAYEGYNAQGKIGNITFGNKVTAGFKWLPDGQLSQQKISSGNDSVIMNNSYKWDHLANMKSVRSQYDSLSGQSFSYDPAGRLKQVNMPGRQENYEYDAGGNIKVKNGIQFTCEAYRKKFALNGSDTVFSASYDAAGNMTSKRDKNSAFKFVYNAYSQLTEVYRNDSLQYKYTYDDNGSRLGKTTISTGTTSTYVSPNYIIDSGSTGSTHTKYILSPSGLIASLTTEGAAANKLVQAQRENIRQNSGLDKSTGITGALPKEIQQWLQKPYFESIAIWALAAIINIIFLCFFMHNYFSAKKARFKPLIPLVLTLFIFSIVHSTVNAEELIINVQAENHNSKLLSEGTLFYHQSQLNSVNITTDEHGSVQTQISYLPYGEIYHIKGPDDFKSKFSGKELESETGLYYFQARYYDPELSCFTTADDRLGGELTDNDIFNRYAYCLNNPVNLIDPFGHDVFSWFASLVVDILEVGAGIAIDALSGGSLSAVGDALIGAGIGGAMYTATHYSNFSWKDWGIQQAIGVVMGDLLPGGEGEADETGSILDNQSDAADVSIEEPEAISTHEIGANEQVCSEEVNADGSITKYQCFPAGTIIKVENGEDKIEDISEGDKVWSYNEKTGKPELNKVAQLFKREADSSVTISAGSLIIKTTTEHPFMVKEKGWTPAKDLKQGDKLATLESGEPAVTAVDIQSEKFTVYNFEVENAHTYYVSAAKVLVHNDCKPKARVKGKSYDVEIRISRSKWPQSAKHIEEAQKNGQPSILTIERGGAKANRRASLKGVKTKAGCDRDEYPPAMFSEGGEGASVKLINSSDNRGSGSYFGSFLRYTNKGGRWEDGTRVWFHVVP
jgi:RHS repeat-associated protein